MTGRTIGNYEILDKLGAGGMGVVWKARDTRLDRLVAIKMLPAEKAADPERKRRFVLEAKAASALNHPNIITIHDISCEGGMDFIVMEYVRGKPLDQVIPRKGLRLNEVLNYAIQIADAMARAHGAGIVHRDLKPGNIMITDDGLVKVLDFGLVKEVSSVSPETSMATIPGQMALGTPAYMAPEMALGEPVDGRADIYALGCVAYYLLTGQLVFEAEKAFQMIAKHLQTPPVPPSQRTDQHVSAELEDLILKCLAKDAKHRPQSARELAEALSRVPVTAWGEADATHWWTTRQTVERLAGTSRVVDSVGVDSPAVSTSARVL